MYEENKKVGLTSLIMKIIIVIIFILFTAWLLSLTTKDLSKSLNVLTDNVFSENIEKMKKVGQEYYTTERLPEKVGDVKKLTLQTMYDRKLILELKDKNGKACSAENSYVSIEKLDKEYQMKVYLDCSGKDDYIIAIMGCYNYCESDICEKKPEIEYQYKKITSGSCNPWGEFTGWSTTSVKSSNTKDVQTKIVKEEYTYDKEVKDTKEVGNATCPELSGYANTGRNGSICNYSKVTSSTVSATCPELSGYVKVSQSGLTCNYSKASTETMTAVCPTVSGYTNTSKSGKTCSYTKTSTNTTTSVCPTLSGYTNTGKSGKICNYTKTSTDTIASVCPTLSGYNNTGKSGTTCNYSKTTQATTTSTCPTVPGYNNTGKSGTTCNYSKTTQATTTSTCPDLTASGYTNTGKSGKTCSYSASYSEEAICWKKDGYHYDGIYGGQCRYSYSVQSSNYSLRYIGAGDVTGSMPSDTSTRKYVMTSSDYIYDCTNACAFVFYYTYDIYEKVYDYDTAYVYDSLRCNNGGTPNANGQCVTYSSTTKEATCSKAGYTVNANGQCVGNVTSTTTKAATCTQTGYTLNSAGQCVGNITSTTTKAATCTQTGYALTSAGSCAKTTTSTTTKTATCTQTGYKITSAGSCAKTTTSTTTKTATCTQTGYALNSAGVCVKTTTSTTTKEAKCPEGSSTSNNSCVKSTLTTTTKNAKCGTGEVMKNGICYKEITSTVKETGVKDVTYYRYRTRTCTESTTTYKWSITNNDTSLLNDGYTLTGKTRVKEVEGEVSYGK